MSDEITISIDRKDLPPGAVLLEDASALIEGFYDAVVKMIQVGLGYSGRTRAKEEARQLARIALTGTRPGSGVLVIQPVGTPTSRGRVPSFVGASEIVDGINEFSTNGLWPEYFPPSVRNRLGFCVAQLAKHKIPVKFSVREGEREKSSTITSDVQAALCVPEQFKLSDKVVITGIMFELNKATRTFAVDVKPRKVTVEAGDFFDLLDTDLMRWQRIVISGVPKDPACKRLSMKEPARLADDAELDGIETPDDHARIAQLSGIGDVLSRIDGFSSLKKGWDSYEAEVIEPSVTEFATSFVRAICTVSVSHGISPTPPFVVPTQSGGVQFEWESNGRVLEIEITDDMKFKYLKEEGERSFEGSVSRWEALRLVRWFETGEPE